VRLFQLQNAMEVVVVAKLLTGTQYLTQQGILSGRIDKSVSILQRWDLEGGFQEALDEGRTSDPSKPVYVVPQPHPRALVGSLQTISTLWTLTKGIVAYLMEPNLDPGVELQAAKRERRFEQTVEVTFIRFDCSSLANEQRIVAAQHTTNLIKDSITRVIPNRDEIYEVVELDQSSRPSAAKKIRSKQQTVTDDKNTLDVWIDDTAARIDAWRMGSRDRQCLFEVPALNECNDEQWGCGNPVLLVTTSLNVGCEQRAIRWKAAYQLRTRPYQIFIAPCSSRSSRKTTGAQNTSKFRVRNQPQSGDFPAYLC